MLFQPSQAGGVRCFDLQSGVQPPHDRVHPFSVCVSVSAVSQTGSHVVWQRGCFQMGRRRLGGSEESGNTFSVRVVGSVLADYTMVRRRWPASEVFNVGTGRVDDV